MTLCLEAPAGTREACPGTSPTGEPIDPAPWSAD